MSSSPEFDPSDRVEAIVGSLVCGADALDRVVRVEGLVSAFAAQRFRDVEAARQQALADPARVSHASPEVIERSLRLELAAALRVTEHRAGALFAQADGLVNRYPSALAALSAQRITEAHAVVLTEALDAVEPEFREELVAQAVVLAEREPVGTFRRRLRLLIDRARVVTLEKRHRAALEERRTYVQAADDGMAWTMIYGPAVEAQAISNRVTAMAKRIKDHPDETRTLDQVRADVMGDLLMEGWTDQVAPEARGLHATVAVTVPVLTLLDGESAGEGDVESSVGSVPTVEPAVVEGVGPIPIGRARELCGGADGWMRVLTHPETGMVLSVGRDQYRPPPGLRRLVRWRAATCMAPGCNHPADRCEIDHNIAWEHGGTTELNNLAPFCKNHHIIKHHGNWTVTQIADTGGAMLWTSPAGRQHRVEPERRVVAFTPDPQPPPF